MRFSPHNRLADGGDPLTSEESNLTTAPRSAGPNADETSPFGYAFNSDLLGTPLSKVAIRERRNGSMTPPIWAKTRPNPVTSLPSPGVISAYNLASSTPMQAAVTISGGGKRGVKKIRPTELFVGSGKRREVRMRLQRRSACVARCSVCKRDPRRHFAAMARGVDETAAAPKKAAAHLVGKETSGGRSSVLS